MSLHTDNFYNRFSFLYPLVDLVLTAQKKRLFREVNAMPAGKLLEIGTGNGSHFKWYQTHTITGIDSSVKMLKTAAGHLNKNITLLQMDAASLSFPCHSFDYIILSHVIAVVDDPEKVLEEACRVLKPGGKIFILNHFTPANWLGYTDRFFNFFARRLHFRSVFYADKLTALKKFTLVKEINFGWHAYFKLLIYSKP